MPRCRSLSRDIALPIESRATVTDIEILDIAPAGGLEGFRKTRHIAGRREQMHVVGHPDIGVHDRPDRWAASTRQSRKNT